MKQYTQAVIWEENGDHPLDDTRWVHDGRGVKTETEGKIVRYYRHPFVDGDMNCPYCHVQMNFHGWIDSSPKGHIVCPGDYILTIDNQHFPLHPEIFRLIYGEQ